MKASSLVLTSCLTLRQDIEILGAFISTIKEMELVQSLLIIHGSYVL